MRFVRPLALFVLIAIVLVPLSWLPAPWAAWRPATCLPDACFCEALGTGFIRQPIDTWSNLAFVLAGLLILEDVLRPASTRSNLLAQRRAYGVIYAFAVIVIGLGSWFYHASLTFVGQWFDVMGMYLLGTFMVLYNVARLRPVSSRAFAVGYVLFNIVLGLSLIVVPELRRYLFGGLLVVTIGLEVIIRRRQISGIQPAPEDQSSGYTAAPDEIRLNPIHRVPFRSPANSWPGDPGHAAAQSLPYLRTKFFIAALLIYLLAQFIWTLDLNHIVCDPDGVLQGHAVWHILTALSAGLLYLYYRSENDLRVDTHKTSA